MAKVDLVMPKMGESIMEATILKWLKQPGDTVEADETILEIATDKVDSEVPSPVSGKITELLYKEDEVVEIGKVIARIETDASVEDNGSPQTAAPEVQAETPQAQPAAAAQAATAAAVAEAPVQQEAKVLSFKQTSRFYSPLVKNIARQEGLSTDELESINGSGHEGRVTKSDILAYIENRTQAPAPAQPATRQVAEPAAARTTAQPIAASGSVQGNIEIVQMDRMRRIIAENMVKSKQISAHVTSFVEADVTNLVNWRNKHKDAFQKRYGDRLTFTPLFVEAIARAIHDFPGVNASVEGDNLIIRKDVNIGMAAALPNNNLIVPVIRNADQLSLAGIARQVNDLAGRARQNKLKPEEIQGGTFTLTNVGTFGNLSGTPIILQPQVAIMSTGSIIKKPAVVETDHGDLIAIRHMMFISMSYDHRVVDGYLGGSFIRRVADYLEAFDVNRGI